MKIRLKEAITTEGGVTYPAGYTFAADSLINLPNGFTTVSQLSEVRSGMFVSDEVMRVAVRDVPKLLIELQGPS